MADTCVARVPIFRDLSGVQQQEVAGFAHPIEVATGEVVASPRDRDRRLLVVHSGRLRVVQYLPNGREQIVRMLEPGEVFGELSFVLGRPPVNFAIVDAASRLCTFRHQDLAGIMRKHPDVGTCMLQTVAARLVSAERMLTALTGSEVSTRVAAYLLDLPASIDAEGNAVVRLPMAKKDIASYLGTTPETFSRRLREFADLGLITTGRRNVVITDIDGLTDAAEP